MAMFQPVAEVDANDAVQATYGRIKEMFGAEIVPAPFLYLGRVDAFLKDFYMNYKKFVHGSGALDGKTRKAIALAVSCHAKSKPWMVYFREACLTEGWEEQQIAEIIAVASTNYMYNTFFKFRELSGSQLFDGLPVGLRAHTFTNVSLDEKLIELIDIAISDLNACKPCVSGHVTKARNLGLNDEQILEAVQCASVVYAGSMFVNSALD
jgi:alkyl hydroperoxide reductase subunit D